MLTPSQLILSANQDFADNTYQKIRPATFRKLVASLVATFVAQASANVPEYELGRYYSPGFVILHNGRFLKAGQEGYLPAPTDLPDDANWVPTLSPASGDSTLYQLGTVAALRLARGQWVRGRLYILYDRTDPDTGEALGTVYVRALSTFQLEPEGYLIGPDALSAEPVRVSYDLASDTTGQVAGPGNGSGYTDAEINALLAKKVSAPIGANLATVRQSLAAQENEYEPGRLYGIAGLWNGASTTTTVYVVALQPNVFSPHGILRAANGTLAVVSVNVPDGTTGAVASYTVQQQHALQLATLGVQGAPVMVYKDDLSVKGYPTIDEVLADNDEKTFQRFNIASLTMTKSNDPLKPGWASYSNGEGATFYLNDNVVLSLPGSSSDSLRLTNFFFFQTPGSRGGRVELLTTTGAEKDGNGEYTADPATLPKLINNTFSVPLRLRGGAIAIEGGNYSAIQGSGVIHLFGNVSYGYLSPDVVIVDHTKGTGGGGGTGDAYTKAETDQRDAALQQQIDAIVVGPPDQLFVFEPGYADSYTFTAGPGVAGVYGTEGLSNVSQATYYIGLAVTALPLTIQAGDKIRIDISRQNVTQVASVTLSK